MSQLIKDLQTEYKESFSETKFKGNIFQKRFYKLNLNLLARALQIYQFKTHLSAYRNKIEIGNNLTLDVSFEHSYSTKYNEMDYSTLKRELWDYGRRHNINVNILIDKIKIATYTLEGYSQWSYYGLLTAKKYECKKEIFHKMPYQFIKMLETWCKQIISEFDMYLAKLVEEDKNAKLSEKNKAKEQHKKEKELLSKYN